MKLINKYRQPNINAADDSSVVSIYFVFKEDIFFN